MKNDIDRSPITDPRREIAAAGHDYVHDQDPPGRLLAATIAVLIWIFVGILAVFVASGCSSVPKIPDGTDVQVSLIGIDIAPLGQLPQYPSVTFGSKTVIARTAPRDANGNTAAGINRMQARVPGIDVTSTVATSPGELGDQLAKSEGAIRALHGTPPASPITDNLSPITVRAPP